MPLLWATDCELVWPILNDGTPINPEAVLVRWWTAALIPAPPQLDEPIPGGE